MAGTSITILLLSKRRHSDVNQKIRYMVTDMSEVDYMLYRSIDGRTCPDAVSDRCEGCAIRQLED